VEQNFTTKANLREHLMVHEAGGTEQPPNGAIVAPSPGYAISSRNTCNLQTSSRKFTTQNDLYS